MKLTDCLLSLGFRCSRSDTSLFILKTVSGCLYILIYVDDIIVIGFKSSLISEFIASLSTYFPVKDLGSLHYFLGIEVTRSASGLYLSQCKYISNLLVHINMHQSKPVSTHMPFSLKLSTVDGCSFDDPHLYQSVVGSLQYLAFTKPDIFLLSTRSVSTCIPLCYPTSRPSNVYCIT